MKTNPKVADLSLIGVAMLWGAGFIATQAAIKAGIPTSLILAVRFVMGALIIFAFKAKSIVKITKQDGITGVIAGTLLFFSFFAQTVGQAESGISNAAFITAIYVVLVPFISWLFTGKHPKLKMFILVFLTLAGVFILTYQRGISVFTLSFGDIMLLLCALGFAAHIAYLGLKAKGMHPAKLTFLQLITAAGLGIIFFFTTGLNELSDIDWTRGMAGVAYLGIFSTAVCYLLQTWAQSITTSAKAAIMMSAESIFGALFSVLLGYELFRWNMPVGGLIIFISVVLLEVEFKKQRTRISV